MTIVRDMISDLRNAWSQISNQSSEKANREAAGLDIAG
jgi:flagellin-specific chaperone FliS